LKIGRKLIDRIFSGDNKIKLLDQRYLPRWIVILIDSCLAAFSFFTVYLILSGTPITFHKVLSVEEQGLVIVLVNLCFFFVFKTFAGIVRHSTFTDLTKLALASFFTFLSLLLFNIGYEIIYHQRIFLNTSLIIYLLLSFSLMLLFRVSVKETYQYLRQVASGNLRKRVAIVGTDDTTIALGKALLTESDKPLQLVAFITNSSNSKQYKILGKPLIPMGLDFKETLDKLALDAVMLVSESFTGKEKNEIVEDCLSLNLEILNVPSLEKWNRREDIQQQIKPLQIEDLLERPEIKIDSELIQKDLSGKTILVTGGAGSIGSEIVRQLLHFHPTLVVILDQAESALHDLELQLQREHPEFNFIIELADISNMYRMELMFEKYKFDLIYHAAAYKHVPLIERNPHEAIYVNILGTVNVAVLATKFEIEKFVMVSTDKAVNPTNVMGASKRAAEMYVQALQNEKGIYTRFITTRFGNVLGSSGSVIPHFRRQIMQGGPVTVTHKDIIRYFMTISEACQLVLQAGTMGKGGEIYVFDMGEPVKILDMAKKMIRLSGFEPDVDIDIKITGLRPGEKLFEELLNDTSTTLPTHHPKIMIAKIPSVKYDFVKKKVKEIIKTATQHNDVRVVKLLKELVPEFKSENSEFSQLDVNKVVNKPSE
jgi:FlaA1/EpsC-like NDP-sugar epimerase